MQAYGAGAEVGGHLLIESQLTIRIEFDILAFPGGNNPNQIIGHERSGTNMVDGEIDRIQEGDRTRCRHRREYVHIVRNMAQIDQAIRLGRELIGGDQSGCCLSDARSRLQTYCACLLVRRDDRVQCQVAIGMKFDALTRPGCNNPSHIIRDERAGTDVIDREVDHIKQIDRTRYRHGGERIHLVLALTQVDQAIRLGRELVCNDQAGSTLSDVVITLQSDRPCILVRGQLEIQSQLTI